jgi:hypothetical protein
MGYRTLFLAAPALAATLLAAGCGSQHATGTSSSASAKPGGGASVSPSANTSLTIKYTPKQGQAAKTWTLTCDPVGGSHPNAKTACTELQQSAGKDPFAPVAKGQMCTMIYGGPQVSTVTGTWNGKPVSASFDRKNGCETTRWDHLAALVGETPVPR